MNRTNPFFALLSLVLFIYAFVLLFLSSEVLYALFAVQSTITESNEFYYFIVFIRKPLVLVLNYLAILAWVIHCFLLLKNNVLTNKAPFFSTQFWHFIHQISKIVSVFFIPFALYCVLYLIPFGDASMRTLFLNELQLSSGYKVIALIGSISMFLCALTNGFLWLQQLNVTPRRPQFIVKLFVLIWAVNLIYLLFVIN